MGYIIVDALRTDGVLEDEFSNSTCQDAIDFSSEYIDRVCLQFFEERTDSIEFDGTGSKLLVLDTPLLEMTKLEWQYSAGSWDDIDTSNFKVYNRIPQDQSYPRIEIFEGSRDRLQTSSLGVFPEGALNIRVTGKWGFVEKDGSSYIIPRMIQKCCKIMSVVWMNSISDDSLIEILRTYGVYKERTKHHSYEVVEAMSNGELTGIPMVDLMLRRFKRKGRVSRG